MKLKLNILTLLMVAIPYCHLQAQEIGLEYTSEWQTDIKNRYNWVNQLHASFKMDVSRSVAFEACTFSVAKTAAEPLVADLQGYSNIEAENLPLALATLGFSWKYRSATWYAGIRNVNEDYFTTEMTSFFTNSSCGIFPTVPCGHEIANYPMATWSLHYIQSFNQGLTLNASVYNGTGSNRLLGHDNVFKIDPKNNGVFSVTSLDYSGNGKDYDLGCSVLWGVPVADGSGEQTETATPTSKERKTYCAVWLGVEQALTDKFGILAHCSLSTRKDACSQYYGLGALYTHRSVEYGLYGNFARFDHDNESDIELSCKFPIWGDRVYMQPAVHFINAKRHFDCVGLLRIGVNIL